MATFTAADIKAFSDFKIATVSRVERGNASFMEDMTEQFGISADDAAKVLEVFYKIKAVKMDAYMGRVMLKHGAFWDAEVIGRAVAQYDTICAPNVRKTKRAA